MTTIINAVSGSGLTQTADGSGIVKLQSNGVTTNALAWVNFNGTTSPGTIRSQYNVSSVTKNGTGDYTVNFTNALADANYCTVAGGGGNVTYLSNATQTTTARQIISGYANSLAGGVTFNDSPTVYVVIFGN